MSSDRQRILDMLEANQITAADAARLLDKLGQPAPASTDPVVVEVQARDGEGRTNRIPRYLRIQGTDKGTRFNIQVPLKLLKTGIKLEAMMPRSANEELKEKGVDLHQLSELDLDELTEALSELQVDVDGKKGEKVRIFCD